MIYKSFAIAIVISNKCETEVRSW